LLDSYSSDPSICYPVRRIATGLCLLLSAALPFIRGAFADDADDQYNFAAGLYNEKLYEEATKQFEKFAEENPKHEKAPHALFGASQCYQLLGQYDKAAAVYERMAAQFPAHDLIPQARLQQGECHWELKQIDKARAAFTAATQSNDEAIKAPAAYWAGECCFSASDLPTALRFYQQAAAFPQHEVAPFAFYSIGLCQSQLAKPAEAAAAFQKVYAAYPQCEVAPECEYRYAAALNQQKKLAEAQVAYSAFVEKYEQSPFAGQAYLGLGYCQFQQKDYANAASSFRQAVARLAEDAELRSESLLRLGDCQFNLKQFDAAMDSYGQVVDGSPSPLQDQATYWLAAAHRAKKQLDRALSLYLQLLTRFPQSAVRTRTQLRIAEVLTEQKKYSEAIDAYKELQSLSPDKETTEQIDAGINYIVSQQSSQGGAEAERVAAQLKGEPAAQAWAQLGNGAFGKSEFEKSARFFETALQHAPKGSEWEERALYGLAATQVQLKQTDKALANYLNQLKDFPKGRLTDHARVDVAWLCLTRAQPAQAEDVLQPLLKNLPVDKILAASALRAAAEAAARQKNPDRAIELFQQLLAGYSDQTGVPEAALLGVGLAQMEKQQFPEASRSFKQLLDRNPSAEIAPTAYLQYAMALGKQGKNAEAVEAYRKIIDDHPTSPCVERALYEKAWMYLNDKKPDRSLECFNTLAAKYPQGAFAAEAFFHVGDYYFDTGDVARSAENYGIVVEKYADAGFVDKALYRLGSALYQQKDMAGASEAFRKVADRFPKSEVAAESLYWLADSLERTGRTADATAAYNRFVRSNPAHALTPKALLGLTRTHVAQKNFPEALASLDRIDAKAEAPILAEVVKLSGDLLFAQQQYKEALESYLKVTIVYGASAVAAESQFLIGQCQEQLGNADKAKEAYQKVIDRFPESQFAAAAKKKLGGG